jgi:hypothetical protein
LCYIHFSSFYICYIQAILILIFFFTLECKFEPFEIIKQIRRSSYSEVVKTTEIYKHVDILGIQTYVINNSSVVFLSKRTRPHPKRNNICKIGHTSNSHCKTCDRNLVDSSFFCSLACKVNHLSQTYLFVLFIISLLVLLYIFFIP